MSRSAVVIDDDIRIGELVRLLVEKCGFQVDLERDGNSGLQRVRSRKPDLVITDMLLPGLHGLDICKAIRSDTQLRHVKIIAMTAVFRSRQFQLDARGVRFDALLEKPFDINKMRDSIRTLFPDACNEAHDTGNEAARGSEGPESEREIGESLIHLKRRWEQYRVYPDRRELLREMLDELGRLTGMTAYRGDRTVSELFAEMKQVIQGVVKNRGAILETDAARMDQSVNQLKEILGMTVSDAVPPSNEPRKQADRSQKTTAPAVTHLLEERNIRSVCLITDDPERFHNLTKGLGVFGYRLIRKGWLEAEGECPELHALLIDLRSYMKDPDPERLSYVEQVRRHGGEDIPAVVIADHPAIEDRILEELVQHGCWDFYTDILDAFGVASFLNRISDAGDTAPDRILIADDQSLSEHVQIILKARGLLTETVRDVKDAWSTVEAFRPDLIIVGEGLGRLTAIGLIRYLRAMDSAMPIVVIAETPDAELVHSVSEAGCSDVLPLGLAEDRMAMTLRSRMRTYRSARRARDYDGVTGALHFSRWMDYLKRDHRWAMERGQAFLCATIQLDNLAGLNRQYGIAFSDRLMRALVVMLDHHFKSRATVGRSGTGRFNMYMGELGSRDAASMLNGFAQLSSSIPFLHETGTLQITVSIGAAMGQSGETHHQLLTRAEHACRRALAQGGNDVVILQN